MYLRKKQIFHSAEKTRGKKKAWTSSNSKNIRINSPKSKKGIKELTKDNQMNDLYNLLKFYISRSTIHGVKYILDPKLHPIEKIIWLIFVIVSICLTANVFVIIFKDFQSAPTEVIVESTSHRVSFVPFPSVTICSIDRVDWKKAMNFERKISNNSAVIYMYRQLVATLSKTSSRGFYKLSFLNKTQDNELSGLNVTDLMLNVMPDCEDLFHNCSWRNIPQNCCDIFKLQKSEHGLCYSFNSKISESPSSSNAEMRKVTAFGSRSALQVNVELGNVIFPPHEYREKKKKIEPGILISINDPLVWPNVVSKIKAGSVTNVNIKCSSGYASKDVLNLPPNKIPCRLMDLKRNVRYSQETCISDCRLDNMIKYCGCNPSFYFASVNVTSCTVKDFKCLHKEQGKFLNYQNPGDDIFREGAEDIMTCDCPPACNYYNYEMKLLSVPVENNNIILDIHYEGPVGIRYKMNVVTTSLKLLVNFGGVFGLFVGGSIISIIEPIYIFLRAAFFRLQAYYLNSKIKREKENSTLDSMHLKLYLSDFPKRKPTLNYNNFHITNKRF